ncbi:50S ribosomal protein L35 [Aliicoccus persicus]|uniref:Large ribosomal subunit protein bL35 n=1 Tax=Aliicoccus persicus TaxID=930138 RepID=A0A662Z3Y3_9STAP|nr:50S ribosomal protein L35 [Aliicoccus persicus]SEV86650.1 LSU ribosomal protein L35P [Aliicoccus persicus]
MPKMKTHKGYAKRVKRTATGKFKRHRAFTSHLFANKSTKQKRHLRKATLVAKGDARRLTQLLARAAK